MREFESRFLLVDDDAVLEFDASSLSGSVGQGLSLAVLGGYRSAAANLVWLDMNASWERRDFDGTLTRIELASTIDPRPEIFWLNGARIIANDMPSWGTSDGGGENMNPSFDGTSEEIVRRFGTRALGYLEKGRLHQPESSALVIEQAVICWRKLDDLERSAALFLEATTLPGAPYYASRIYAEILIKLGREQEALDFLVKHYQTLPEDDLMAMKPIVAERIATLRVMLAQ